MRRLQLRLHLKCHEIGDSIHGYRIRAEARKIGDQKVIGKTGRHKAQRLVLTENAEATVERKLVRIPKR